MKFYIDKSFRAFIVSTLLTLHSQNDDPKDAQNSILGIKKTTKGEIGIENFRGRISLRWRYQGERFTLNLPYSYLLENLHHGTIKATEIKLDTANKQVEISEAFARMVKGTNHASRIQKGTKMENVRYLPLPDLLVILLESVNP